MANCQRLLDTLDALRITTVSALEHVQANRDEFVKHSTKTQIEKYEKLIMDVRIVYGYFERECNGLELALSKRDSSSDQSD